MPQFKYFLIIKYSFFPNFYFVHICYNFMGMVVVKVSFPHQNVISKWAKWVFFFPPADSSQASRIVPDT